MHHGCIVRFPKWGLGENPSLCLRLAASIVQVTFLTWTHLEGPSVRPMVQLPIVGIGRGGWRTLLSRRVCGTDMHITSWTSLLHDEVE